MVALGAGTAFKAFAEGGEAGGAGGLLVLFGPDDRRGIRLVELEGGALFFAGGLEGGGGGRGRAGLGVGFLEWWWTPPVPPRRLPPPPPTAPHNCSSAPSPV